MQHSAPCACCDGDGVGAGVVRCHVQDQGARADALLVQAHEAGAKGDLIIYNLELVEQLLAALNSQLASGAAETRSMRIKCYLKLRCAVPKPLLRSFRAKPFWCKDTALRGASSASLAAQAHTQARGQRAWGVVLQAWTGVTWRRC